MDVSCRQPDEPGRRSPSSEPPNPTNPRRRVRKREVLDFLWCLFEHGSTALEVLTREERGYAPSLARRRPTSAEIAVMLLDELGQHEYMALAYDPDALDRVYAPDAKAKWRRETEEGVKRRLVLVWKGVGGPTGDAQLGELDSYLAAERDHWRGRAEQLRAELGPAFLKGTPEKRASMVRDWIRNFQEQGRLPGGRIPPYRDAY